MEQWQQRQVLLFVCLFSVLLTASNEWQRRRRHSISTLLLLLCIQSSLDSYSQCSQLVLLYYIAFILLTTLIFRIGWVQKFSLKFLILSIILWPFWGRGGGIKLFHKSEWPKISHLNVKSKRFHAWTVMAINFYWRLSLSGNGPFQI